jgi:hypothetical protein
VYFEMGGGGGAGIKGGKEDEIRPKRTRHLQVYLKEKKNNNQLWEERRLGRAGGEGELRFKRDAWGGGGTRDLLSGSYYLRWWRRP